jgi:hypothetical protein
MKQLVNYTMIIELKLMPFHISSLDHWLIESLDH